MPALSDKVESVIVASRAHAIAGLSHTAGIESVNVAAAAILASELSLAVYAPNHTGKVHPAFASLKQLPADRTRWAELVSQALKAFDQTIVLMPSPREERIGIGQPTLFYPGACERNIEVAPSVRGAKETLKESLFGLPKHHFRALLLHGIASVGNDRIGPDAVAVLSRHFGKLNVSKADTRLALALTWSRVPVEAWQGLIARLDA